MADTEITALTALTNLGLTDEIVIVDNSGTPTTKKVDFQNFGAYGNFPTAPVLKGSTTPGTQGYDNQRSYYHRVGKLVYVQIELDLNSLDGTTAGNMQIGNLPYTSIAAVGNSFGSLNVGYTTNITLTSNYNIRAWVNPSSTDIYLYQSNGTTMTALTPSDFSSTSIIILSGSYIAA